ncbi:MAG: hypothetical protein IID32_07695, partial [Planctomycetes bacterium]|nr:hypothetical protein [Planctomycetota bacterium]
MVKKKMIRNTHIQLTGLAIALGVTLLFWVGCDRSEDADWPARTIRVYVGWSAGGTSDITTRAVALGMEKKLGKKILVSNVTGAMGSIGAARVAEASPDGYLWFGGGAEHGGFFMSPGVVPLLTGTILALLSLWYTLSTLLRNSTASPGPWIRSWLGDQEKRRVLVIIAITAIYAVGMLGRVPFLWMAAIFTRLGAMVISPWFIRILSIPREILL